MRIILLILFYLIERMKYYDSFLKVFFDWLNMPTNVFANSNSNISDNKVDTTLFVQKPYLRSTYIEANIEEDINFKSQFRNKNLPDPISIREAVSKNYVDKKIMILI